MFKKKAVVKHAKGFLQPLLIGLLVLAAFAIGSMWTELRMIKGGKGIIGNQPSGQEAPAQAPEQKEVTEVTGEVLGEVLANPAAVMGNENAKVTVVEFTDFQCPYCKRYFDQSFDQLIKEYVQTGKVRYVARDLPLEFHPNAHLAAEAARCSGDQGKYFEFHSQLFTNQDTWAEASDAGKLFNSYAAKLGLDRTKFANCLTNGEKKAAVDADLALAQKAGMNGTPSFIINGKVLIGAQPYSAFQAMINEALK